MPFAPLRLECLSLAYAFVRSLSVSFRLSRRCGHLRVVSSCFFVDWSRHRLSSPAHSSAPSMGVAPLDASTLLPLAPPLNYLCTIRARALLLLVELILISSSAVTHAPRSDRVRCVSLPLPLCLFASTLARSLVMLFPPSSHSAGCAVICCAVFCSFFDVSAHRPHPLTSAKKRAARCPPLASSPSFYRSRRCRNSFVSCPHTRAHAPRRTLQCPL